jgi:cytochrome P450
MSWARLASLVGTRRDLPHGPRGAALQTFLYALGPYDFYRSCGARYGDLFTVPTLLGPLVVCGHPDGVRTIFTADADHYERWATDAVAPLLGDHALTLTSGEQHARDRKLLMPAFHGARMATYGGMMRDATRRVANRWSHGSRFRVLDATHAISLEIILRAVFGAEDDAAVERLQHTIANATAALSPTIMLFRAMRRPFGGVGPWARFVRAREALDTVIHREISLRRASTSAGEDIVSLLLSARDEAGQGLSDVELRDQLLTMVFAGHETTAIGIAWAFYWLDRFPDARERLEREIDALGPDPTAEALARASYLGAVCDEVLRLHPIIPEVIRKLRKPLTVMNHTIPSGVAIAACTSLLHVSPSVFPEPDRFRPERFTDRRNSPFEYIPFGGGTRRCIGAAFASMQMRIVIGNIVARWRLVRDPPVTVRPRLRNLTVGPAGGIAMRAFLRSAGA